MKYMKFIIIYSHLSAVGRKSPILLLHSKPVFTDIFEVIFLFVRIVLKMLSLQDIDFDAICWKIMLQKNFFSISKQKWLMVYLEFLAPN